MKAVQSKYWTWQALSIFIGGIIFIPLLFVLEGFFPSSDNAALLTEQQENINHLKTYALPQMTFTTLRMIIGVGLVSIILGVMPAYFIANYKFPLRNFLKRANVFPLTIPTYIMGFVYASIFSITGSFTKLAMLFFTPEEIFSWNINVVTEGWLMFFLGFSLYPYVYSSCLLHFSTKNKALDEVGATLGVSRLKRFFKVILPLAIPTILGSVSLVVMEVINDYGAMSYFNVKTFTTGIFQAKQMNFSGSLYLSAVLFIAIAFIFSSLFFIRSIKKVKAVKSTVGSLKSVSKKQGFLFSFICFIPFFLGFIIPVAELIYLAIGKFDMLLLRSLLLLFSNAIQIALIGAILILLLSIILHYNGYLNKGKLSSLISNISTLGYAIPGAVIAVAVIGFIYAIDANGNAYQFTINSLILMIFAYVIRFFAVGYNTIDATFSTVANHLPDASRTFGFGSFKTFFKVYFPLLKSGLLTTLAIVTIDILKELPLTLILQPFNFETLATKSYKKAKVAESVADASPYALMLILCGVLVTLLLIQTDKNSSNVTG